MFVYRSVLSQTNPQRTTTPICPLTKSSTRTRQLPLSPTTPQGNTLSHLYIHIFTPFLDCSPLWTLSPLTQTNPHPTLSSLLGTRDTCRSPLSTMYPWTVPLVLSPWPALQTTITTTTNNNNNSNNSSNNFIQTTFRPVYQPSINKVKKECIIVYSSEDDSTA